MFSTTPEVSGNIISNMRSVNPSSNRMTDSCNDKNPMLNEIIGVSNVSTSPNILDLPLEIKRKIAYQLSSENYENLRLTCKNFTHDLESFQEIRHKLNECRGELRANFQRIWIEKKVKILLKNTNQHVTYALNNTFFGKAQWNENLILGGFDYIYIANYPDSRCVTSLMPACDLDAMRKILFSGLSPGYFSRFIENIPKDSLPPTQRIYRISFFINNKDITHDDLDKLFSVANDVFMETAGAEKLLLASIITGFKNYWCQHSPEDINKNVITQNEIKNIAKSYPDLFTFGTIVHESFPCHLDYRPC